jgi:SAM-dependent methyltransferase
VLCCVPGWVAVLGERSFAILRPAHLKQANDAGSTSRYWDAVGVSSKKHAQTVWRAHSDAVNSAWLEPRLSRRALNRLLKTDLFDEALAGGLFPLLSAHAEHVVGVDVAVSTLTRAGARYGQLRSAGADVRSLPFAGEAFDGIVSNSTLDHFASTDDIATSLAELHRVLRPGGQLLLTLDNLATRCRSAHSMPSVSFPIRLARPVARASCSISCGVRGSTFSRSVQFCTARVSSP